MQMKSELLSFHWDVFYWIAVQHTLIYCYGILKLKLEFLLRLTNRLNDICTCHSRIFRIIAFLLVESKKSTKKSCINPNYLELPVALMCLCSWDMRPFDWAKRVANLIEHAFPSGAQIINSVCQFTFQLKCIQQSTQRTHTHTFR